MKVCPDCHTRWLGKILGNPIKQKCPKCGGILKDYFKPRKHEWIPREDLGKKLEVCKDCGVVRRADAKNLPCKGKVKITVRIYPKGKKHDG